MKGEAKRLDSISRGLGRGPMNDKKGQAILTIRCSHATPEDGPKAVGDPSKSILPRSEDVELAFRWSARRTECILVQRVQKALTSDAIESRPF